MAKSSGLLSLGLDTSLVREMSQHSVGGHLSLFRKNCERITQDNWTLHTNQGLKLEFVSTPPDQEIHQPQLNSEKAPALSNKVNKLFQKRAIVPAIEDGTGFVSPVFVVLKARGQWHAVINLKALKSLRNSTTLYNGKFSSGEGQGAPSVCNQSPNFPGVHTEHGQECNITKSANRILKIQSGFQQHNNIFTIPEIDLTSEISLTTSRWDTDTTERHCTSVRNDGGSPPSYSTSPTIL